MRTSCFRTHAHAPRCPIIWPSNRPPQPRFAPSTSYVALTDLAPIMQPVYICGCTNRLFSTKADWYDCLADLETGSVKHHKGITGTSEDKEFISGVIAGVAAQHPDEYVEAQPTSTTSAATPARLALSLQGHPHTVAPFTMAARSAGCEPSFASTRQHSSSVCRWA